MVADWARSDAQVLADLGRDPQDVIAAADAVMIDLEEVWQPFAARFAALAQGKLAGPRSLPLLGQ
jgi:hypothetical protein